MSAESGALLMRELVGGSIVTASANRSAEVAVSREERTEHGGGDPIP